MSGRKRARRVFSSIPNFNKQVVETRTLLYELQGGKCKYCDEAIEPEQVTLDHMVPLTQKITEAGLMEAYFKGEYKDGVIDKLLTIYFDISNLCACCHECNKLKDAMSKREFLKKREELSTQSFDKAIGAIRAGYPIRKSIRLSMEFWEYVKDNAPEGLMYRCSHYYTKQERKSSAEKKLSVMEKIKKVAESKPPRHKGDFRTVFRNTYASPKFVPMKRDNCISR